MRDDREAVFKSVRAALAEKTADKREALPEWEDSRVVCKPPKVVQSLEEQFRFKFEAAGGIVVDGMDGLAAFLDREELKFGCADAMARPNAPAIEIVTDFQRQRLDDYQFAITRASHGIAETGSLVLTEAGTWSRLAALAPWVHIAVLERAAILPDMPSAIARFGQDRAVLFVTGPSKTADVEGILIKGVHGPGVQVCCLV